MPAHSWSDRRSVRSRAALEAELLVLRQQINVLRRVAPKKLRFGLIDRLILTGACRLFPKAYDALAIVRPDTVVRWHRAVFRSYWLSLSQTLRGWQLIENRAMLLRGPLQTDLLDGRRSAPVAGNA